MKPSKDRLEKRKTLLRIARRVSDSEINPFAPHPLVRAYLLAGGILTHIASETDIPKDSLKSLSQSGGNCDLTDESLFHIFLQATAQIFHREEELGRQVEDQSELTDAERKAILDLNEAHRLTFGQTLFRYYGLAQGGDA